MNPAIHDPEGDGPEPDLMISRKPPSMLRFLWELACGAAWPLALVAVLGVVALGWWRWGAG